MAEIPVQKKSSMAWLWILLALVLLGLVIWWATAGDDDEELAEPVAAEQQADGTADLTAADGPTLAAILANPSQFFGSEFSGEVTVGDTLTDRGFWIESDGSRLFSLIVDEPREVPKDINAGQRLRISGGMIRDASSLSDLEGRELEANTREVIAGQEVIMVVDEADIEILQQS